MPHWIGRLALAACCVVRFACAAGDPVPSPQVIQITSGSAHLLAWLWMPEGSGPFPAVLFNHGRSETPRQYDRHLTLTAAAQQMGPVYVRHGYALLFPFRRGEGLSSSAGPFIGDQLAAEESANGAQARDRLQLTLLATTHLDDGMAALAALKRMPKVDARRIAVVGHSFGGQLALLEAAREPVVRAVVTFGAAAGSWERSAPLRSLMRATVDRIAVPVMLIHCRNDYSLAPGRALDRELARRARAHVLRIYPAVGDTAKDGHNCPFIDTTFWQDDVFRFLDTSLRH